MASIIPTPSGKYRAFVHVNGIRDNEIFSTKKKAQSWANDRESELRKHLGIADDSYTLGDLLRKYAREVSPNKKGKRWELVRLKSFQKRYPKLCSIKLTKLKREDFEDWIKRRSTQVKPSTVNRELNLFSHCLTKARVWRLMAHKPFDDIERPTNPPPRFRRITPEEIETMCHALKYRPDMKLAETHQLTAAAWLLAIETCMRQGEICNLTLNTVDLEISVAHLPDTKNGCARDVPLSPRAIEIIKQLPKPDSEDSPLFQTKAATMSSTFREYRKKTDIVNLVFHDSRHEAITRLVDSNRYNVLEVASITGHKDINELLTYYNKTAAQIASEMAQQAHQSKTQIIPGLPDLNNLNENAGLKSLIQEVLLEQAKLNTSTLSNQCS